MSRSIKYGTIAVLALASFRVFPVAAAQNQTIPGFEQLVERGRIASIDQPDFVSASEAKISDNSWVLGVIIDGQPRAYSLTLLNSHEVVNDMVADQPIAAVW